MHTTQLLVLHLKPELPPPASAASAGKAVASIDASKHKNWSRLAHSLLLARDALAAFAKPLANAMHADVLAAVGYAAAVTPKPGDPAKPGRAGILEAANALPWVHAVLRAYNLADPISGASKDSTRLTDWEYPTAAAMGDEKAKEAAYKAVRKYTCIIVFTINVVIYAAQQICMPI